VSSSESGRSASATEGASCKISQPVCDPAVSDDTALALVRRRCAGCHAEGGKAEHPLLDARDLLHDRGDVALRLSGCEMPPDTTPLPLAERVRLIGWAACTTAETAR